MLSSHPIIPAKAGIHFEFKNSQKGKSKSHWIPAFAGMTAVGVCLCEYKVLFGRSNLDCSESRMDIGSQGSGFDMCLNCLPPPSPFFKGRGCRRRVRGTVGSSKKLLSQHSVNPSPQPSPLVNGRGGAPHGFDFHPLAASLSLFGGLSQQMVGGEDCLSVASSAAAPYAARLGFILSRRK